jgi:hypothetical protein
MKSPLIALTLSLLAGVARPAQSQFPPLPTPIPRLTNADVVYPPVSEHAPRAATLRTSGQNALELFAVTKSGLSHRQFVRVPGQVAPGAGWANWIHHGAPGPNAGPPEGWRRSLPVTGGWFGQGQDVLAFFDVPDTASLEKLAVADLGTYSGTPPLPTSFAFTLQSPGTGTGGFLVERFNPRTLLVNTSSDQLDVFGTSDDVHAPDVHTLHTPLLRLHGTRTGPSAWTYSAASLGQPPFTVNGVQAEAAVGPQAGATFNLQAVLGTPAVPTHLVFVKAQFASEDHVTFVTGPASGGAFSWGIDLGSPRPGAQIVDEPLALFYQWGSITRVCVFATAVNRTTGRFEVFERHFDTVPGTSPSTPAAWTAWQSFGAPSGLASQLPFRLSTAVTWYQGSTLRINLFGHSDSDPTVPERMVEFYWNGSSWQWGALRTPPNGTGIRATSAVVLQSTGYTRISVFGRTGGDATFAGSATVWETYWVSDGGIEHDWQWYDLSWEPAIVRIGF